MSNLNPSATSEDAIAEYIKKKYRAQHEAAQSVHQIAQGLSAYLKDPPVRGRVNQRFLSNTLQAVAFENRQAVKRERRPETNRQKHRARSVSRSPSRSPRSRRQRRHHTSRTAHACELEGPASSNSPPRSPRSSSPSRHATKPRHRSSRSPSRSPVKRPRSEWEYRVRSPDARPRFNFRDRSRSRDGSGGDPERYHTSYGPSFDEFRRSPRPQPSGDPRDHHSGVEVQHGAQQQKHRGAGGAAPRARTLHTEHRRSLSSACASDSSSEDEKEGENPEREARDGYGDGHAHPQATAYSPERCLKRHQRRPPSASPDVHGRGLHEEDLRDVAREREPRKQVVRGSAGGRQQGGGGGGRGGVMAGAIATEEGSREGSREGNREGRGEQWQFDEELQLDLEKIPTRGRGAVGSRVFDTGSGAGPFPQDGAVHAPHACGTSAHVHHTLLPPGGASSGRPVGGALHNNTTASSASASCGGPRKHAKASSGKALVNERVVLLAKQLTDSGVPLELATARAELQVLQERKAEGKDERKKKKKGRKKEKKSRSESKHKA